MPDYSSLKYLFTYAAGDTGYYGTSPALIFACTDMSDESFKSLETPMTLARHPLVKEIMGDVYFVKFYAGGEQQLWNHDRNVQRWVFSLEMRDVLVSMDEKNHDSVLLKTEGKPLGAVTTRDILDACYLPHKYTMSCLDCATASLSEKHVESDHNCYLKRSVRRYNTGHVRSTCLASSCDLSEIREDHDLVNRQTKIDKFVFISPALTREGVPQMVRKVSEHDFCGIQDVSDARSEGQHERKRFVRFQEEVCPTCSMQLPCERYRAEHSRRYCSGPYPTDSKEIVEEILSNVTIPFSNAQIRTLFAHSGILEKRYRRRIVAGTFGMDGSCLVFRIRHKTKPWGHDDAEQFNNFREANKFLRAYSRDPSTHFVTPLTRERKALLCELASHDHSPRNHYDWRTVCYPLLYIRDFGGVLRTTYSYHGKGTTGFGMEIKSLTDIYQNFEGFNYGTSRSHELARSSRW